MAKRERRKLKITCTSSDCQNELHCFKATAVMKRNSESGQCRDCGVDLIDWNRLYEKNISDVKHTFEALKRELIRHHYWHIDISQRAENYARRKGLKGVGEAAEKILRKSVSPVDNPYDGRQTPMAESGKANAIHYAQHATATCCRKCMQYWHSIPTDRELSSSEIRYFTELILLYIKDRMPLLKEEGEKVPLIRKKLVTTNEETD